MRAAILRRLRDEDGAMLVVAAIAMLALTLLAAVVIEVGGWFQHRRHLQVRADAAALAGGQVFNECFATNAFSPGQAQTDIENAARQYAGFASPSGTSYNTQFGGGSGSIAFQSSTYPGGGGSGSDDTQNGVGECSNLTLDVKLTDAGIPSIFSFSPLATIHAHARVELRSIQTARNTFPLAIPDTNPKQVDVTFVDETNGGAELSGCGGAGLVPGTTCTFLLTKGDPVNGLNPWSGAGDVKFPSGARNIGVRVGIGGQVGSCAQVDGGANSSCWDITDVNRGVVMIRDNPASSSTPTLAGVWPTSCSGSPYFSDATGLTACNVGVQAIVDFGTGSTDPSLPKSKGGVSAGVTATLNGHDLPLRYDAGSALWVPEDPSDPKWIIPVDASGSTGSYPISLSWVQRDGNLGGKDCGKKVCEGNFGTVQRFTSATDDDDGPVKLVTLSEPSASMPAYSLTPGTHTLAVTIGLAPNLGLQPSDDPVALRLTHSGSRSTAVNCDGTGNSDFTNAVVNGCATPYQINENDLCPDPSPPGGAADCVPLKTGNLGNTVLKALDERFGGTCPTNYWPRYAQDPNDPRHLLMMLTDFSALSSNGKTEIPVTNFAYFYVIGWTGGPDTCGDWPFPGKQPSGGNLWGYFVKYDAPGQEPSDRKCQLSEITPCVAVLTR